MEKLRVLSPKYVLNMDTYHPFRHHTKKVERTLTFKVEDVNLQEERHTPLQGTLSGDDGNLS